MANSYCVISRQIFGAELWLVLKGSIVRECGIQGSFCADTTILVKYGDGVDFVGILKLIWGYSGVLPGISQVRMVGLYYPNSQRRR